MKPLRVVLAALAAIAVAGTIANAAPGGVHGKPSPSVSASVSEAPEPSETEAPEPTETEAPEPTETESPDAEAKTSHETGKGPDFSGCVGLTGLDNAICRHEALLKIHPDNPGLNNSLGHLQTNAARHSASGTHGKPGS
jgi:hypothetical protein